ncbi:MAG: energy transducer TonB [Chitinophagaceae bacterium]
MTNKELLHASLLDILFDGRNKEYGAYALRKTYDRRLLLAMGLGLSVILLFIFINMLNINSSPDSGRPEKEKADFVITQLQTDPDKPIVPIKPKPAVQKPIEDVATVKNTTIKIVDDQKLKVTEVPPLDLIETSVIGTETKAGNEDEKAIRTEPAVSNNNAGSGEVPVKVESPKPSYGPEFPGGFEALRKWLAKNLATPDQLEAGQTKTVKARFVVDKDGSISTVEIVFSGGQDFDKEVVRACKRMPKWKPAVQNGEPVMTNYILPVTFMGIE